MKMRRVDGANGSPKPLSLHDSAADDEGPPAVDNDEAWRDRARIKAELARLDDGVDPFAAAVRATRMPIIITNPREPDNPIVFANDSFCQLTGYARDEIMGRNCRFLQGPETEPETVDRLRAAIRAKEAIEIEIRNYAKDGRQFWNRLLVAPVHDSGGVVQYFFASQMDITRDRENLAERINQLAEANDRLRAEALERERLEDTLRQAHKMEAIGRLTGGLAHGFNNLLTGISGSLEMLQIRLAQGQFADIERYVNTALGAAGRAAIVTHRLLAFSRRQTLAPRPTELNRLVTGMLEIIRRTVGPAIAVEAITAGKLWHTIVDPNQLENALLNLCINARDAMPDGGRLVIETRNEWLDARTARDLELPAGPYIKLCVSDTGAGMTPEVVRRAFDPFYTTKPSGEGTGLGLSMIYGFARQSGGRVDLPLPAAERRRRRGGRRDVGPARDAAHGPGRDGAAGGRRAHRAHAGERRARRARLQRHRGRRRRGRLAGAAVRGPRRPADHRRRPARRHERPAGRRGGAGAEAAAQDPVHHRLRGRRRAHPRASAAGHACHGQAVSAEDVERPGERTGRRTLHLIGAACGPRRVAALPARVIQAGA